MRACLWVLVVLVAVAVIGCGGGSGRNLGGVGNRRQHHLLPHGLAALVRLCAPRGRRPVGGNARWLAVFALSAAGAFSRRRGVSGLGGAGHREVLGGRWPQPRRRHDRLTGRPLRRLAVAHDHGGVRRPRPAGYYPRSVGCRMSRRVGALVVVLLAGGCSNECPVGSGQPGDGPAAEVGDGPAADAVDAASGGDAAWLVMLALRPDYLCLDLQGQHGCGFMGMKAVWVRLERDGAVATEAAVPCQGPVPPLEGLEPGSYSLAALFGGQYAPSWAVGLLLFKDLYPNVTMHDDCPDAGFDYGFCPIPAWTSWPVKPPWFRCRWPASCTSRTPTPAGVRRDGPASRFEEREAGANAGRERDPGRGHINSSAPLLFCVEWGAGHRSRSHGRW